MTSPADCSEPADWANRWEKARDTGQVALNAFIYSEQEKIIAFLRSVDEPPKLSGNPVVRDESWDTSDPGQLADHWFAAMHTSVKAHKAFLFFYAMDVMTFLREAQRALKEGDWA